MDSFETDSISNDDSNSTTTTLSKGIINDHIGNAEDIDLYEFSELKKLQKQCKLTRKDHYKLAKHYIKINTGLDSIDNEIVKLFRQ